MIKKNIDSYRQKNGSSHREGSRTRVFSQKATGVLMTGLIAGGLLSGCGMKSAGETNPAFGMKPGQQLTVIDTDTAQKQVTDELVVSSIDRLGDVYARSWLSDEELIVDRKTQLWIHNVETNKERILTPGRKAPQLLAVVSPDQRHVFFTEGSTSSKYDIQGYILELSSGKVTPIGKLDMTNEVSWSDENDLITGTPDGKIQLIGLDGKAEELSFQDPNRSELMSHVEKVGNAIFYTGSDKQGYPVLNRFTLNHPQAVTIAEGAMSFAVSPDGKSIAIEKRKWNTSEPARMIILDEQGKEKGIVGQGTLMSRGSWSSDGSKLAFSIYDEDQQGMRGLYVFDQSTGKTTPVTTDIQSYDSPTVWSPAARFLSMYQNISEGGKQLNQSYIVEFKRK
ncbi:WD40 repeat domain-containing protein [Paenibacillus polymyxa]|uniref:WD40 repeat domain-containing protein n=1 Tax=Paenibacillus polymyxa TaxID=1406 RepID=UPI002AB4CA3C|nr:WD40 repeat domain-containing protein [Paenibacillus polymyxa]MDY8048943.1 WD40 repeat domain-containing protein [Paenibacillus polymyxa]